MPFGWYRPSIPAAYASSFGPKREAMYLAELEDRAALLYRLGYGRAQTVARLRGNVRWDFELHAIPKFVERIDGIVNAVYARGGRAGGAPEP